MSLTAYITATPLDSGFFKDIYSSLREFKSRFKERFELDHYMGGVVDDTDPTCEGYHKQLTMNGGEYNELNYPDCPNGSAVFFSMYCDDTSQEELFIEQEDGTVIQITDGGVARIRLYDNGNTLDLRFIQVENGKMWGFDGDTSTTSIYSTTNGETWTLEGTAPVWVNAYKIRYFDSKYFFIASNSHLYYTSDFSTFTRTATDMAVSSFDVVDSKMIILGFVSSVKYGRSSTDGITWTDIATPPVGDFTRQNNYLVGFGLSGSALAYFTSVNGTTWTTRSLPSTAVYQYIRYINGLYFLFGSGTNYNFYTTTNFSTWTTYSYGSSYGILQGITYAYEQYLFISSDKTFYFSKDLTTLKSVEVQPVFPDDTYYVGLQYLSYWDATGFIINNTIYFPTLYRTDTDGELFTIIKSSYVE